MLVVLVAFDILITSTICISACQKIIQQRLASSVTCMTPSDSRPATPGTPSANSSLSLNHYSSLKHIAGVGPSPSPCSNLSVPTTPYSMYSSPSSPKHVSQSLLCKVCSVFTFEPDETGLNMLYYIYSKLLKNEINPFANKLYFLKIGKQNDNLGYAPLAA